MGRAGGGEQGLPTAAAGAVVRTLLALEPIALGLSTGWDAANRGNWPSLVAEAQAFNPDCIELSALGAGELPGLVSWFLRERPSISHLSFHGPSKGMDGADLDAIVRQLASIAHHGHVVMHPDTMGDYAAYRPLGQFLTVENMDARKPVGANAEELARIFEILPEAGFCLDVSHVKSIDPTLVLGHELLDAHLPRLRELHISSVDAGCHHVETTLADTLLYRELLMRTRHVPWILEAAPAE